MSTAIPSIIPMKKVRAWFTEAREALPDNPESAVIDGDRVFFTYHSGYQLPPQNAEYARLNASKAADGALVPLQFEIAPGVLAAVEHIRIYRDAKVAA